MGIITEIRAALAVKRAYSEIKEEYKMDSTVKPGWKTTEFWGKVAVQLFIVFGAVKGFFPPATAAMISGALEGMYGIARAVVKFRGGSLPDLPNT